MFSWLVVLFRSLVGYILLADWIFLLFPNLYILLPILHIYMELARNVEEVSPKIQPEVVFLVVVYLDPQATSAMHFYALEHLSPRGHFARKHPLKQGQVFEERRDDNRLRFRCGDYHRSCLHICSSGFHHALSSLSFHFSLSLNRR